MNALRIGGVAWRELAEAADANFVTHASWVAERLPEMRAVVERGLVLVDSGLPCDTFNFVCRARLDPATAADAAREAVDWFAREGRPFSWWVGPADTPADLGEILVSVGLEPAETELAMAADLARLDGGSPSPGGLRIVRAGSEGELRDFATILAANWSPPDPQVLRFYESAATALLAEESAQWLYVGYLGEVAVATAECTYGGGVAGLYNIATLEPYRRRGFGSAMTLRPLLDARDAGYPTGVLQAADDGVGVYRRLGFEPFGQVTEYKPPGSG